MSERRFVLDFDLRPCNELDQFALLARQDYNLGDRGGWFGDFRGGLYGFANRVAAVGRHYVEVHAWIPVARPLADAEYHLSSILFNMDSAIECLTFALNALGYSAYPTDFRDITSNRALRSIKPRDVLSVAGQADQVPGYGKWFPTVQTLWVDRLNLLSIITDCHDVSKHRGTIFSGGKARMDAPPGFYEKVGAGNDSNRQSDFWPMAEIILSRNVKKPYAERYPTPAEDQVILEGVAEEFADLINRSVASALFDAKRSLVLPVPQFREPSAG